MVSPSNYSEWSIARIVAKHFSNPLCDFSSIIIFSNPTGASHHVYPLKPENCFEVDRTRDKLYIADQDTGAAVPVYLFVDILPVNRYAYTEACTIMDMGRWICRSHPYVLLFGQSSSYVDAE